MDNKIVAIVLAAGQGKRMNTSVAKQFLHIKEKPVIYYSLEAFQRSSVDEIILVTGSEQLEICRDIVETYSISKVTAIIEGGAERYDSVYNALLNVQAADYVLIHDGARPFISVDLIEEVIQQVIISKACIVGTPVKDTIKEVNTEGYITATPDRNILWSAQTPQAFEYKAIMNAYDMFNKEENKKELGFTDDAMIYEAFIRRPVKMLKGDYNNIKLTTPEDLIMAEFLSNSLLCEYDKKKKQFFSE